MVYFGISITESNDMTVLEAVCYFDKLMEFKSSEKKDIIETIKAFTNIFRYYVAESVAVGMSDKETLGHYREEMLGEYEESVEDDEPQVDGEKIRELFDGKFSD